ncbi:MAG: serine/threonine protein kinase, partial [Firmicutes bacterium]|nr:serine/threonine protein kinase [Bacillota bacterium]
MAALNQILSGKYRLVKLLGRGGMSTVYLAEDLTLGKEWAVKELDTSRPEYRRLLEKDGTLAEIEILKALDHPLAPRLVDRFEEDGMIYLVMDRIEGEDLQSVINRT